MPETTSRLSPKDFVQQSNWRGILAVGRDLGAILFLAAVGIYLDNWMINLVLAWMIGVFQFALGEVLTHEASHHNLFKTRKWNDWGEWIYCLPFLFTMRDYRDEHIKHHRFLNTPDEYLFHEYTSHGLRENPIKWYWIWFFRPICGWNGLVYLKSALTEFMTPQSIKKLVLFWAGLIAVSAFTGTLNWVLWFWVLPMIWCYPAYFYWSEIEDHFNTKSGTRSNVGWFNYVTHNNGFHLAHHEYPRIPWYLIRKAHYQFFNDADAEISNGFLDTFRQLRTPIDESSQSFQETGTH